MLALSNSDLMTEASNTDFNAIAFLHLTLPVVEKKLFFPSIQLGTRAMNDLLTPAFAIGRKTMVLLKCHVIPLMFEF